MRSVRTSEPRRPAARGAPPIGRPPAPGLLTTLAAAEQDLPAAQQKVAALIRREPELALHANVGTLAARAGVSPPTVVRFCRALACTGLREFRLRLAQSLAVSASPLHRAVAPGDDLRTATHKILAGAAGVLTQLEDHIAPKAVAAAVARIAAAGRVDCYGVGNTSAFMANDAQARFARLGLHSNAYQDAHLQLVSAATLERGDVLLAISHVGRMPTLLEAVAVAREQHAFIVAITQPGTPLAAAADAVLPVVVPADPSMRVGTEAYLAQLAYLEILMVGVGLRLGASAERRLRRVRTVLQEHGVDAEGPAALQWAWSGPGAPNR